MVKKRTTTRKKTDRELLEYIAITVAEHSKILAVHGKLLTEHSEDISSVKHEMIDLREEMREIRRQMARLPSELMDEVDRVYGSMLNDHEDRIRTLEKAR